MSSTERRLPPLEYLQAAVGRTWTDEDADYIARIIRGADKTAVAVMRRPDPSCTKCDGTGRRTVKQLRNGTIYDVSVCCVCAGGRLIDGYDAKMAAAGDIA